MRLAHVFSLLSFAVPAGASIVINASSRVYPDLSALGRLSNERSCGGRDFLRSYSGNTNRRATRSIGRNFTASKALSKDG
jgi:hypothetical protein